MFKAWGRAISTAFQLPAYKTYSPEGSPDCPHLFGARQTVFSPGVFWVAGTEYPFPGHFGVSSLRSLQLVLSWTQSPASLLLSEGLLFPDRAGGVQKPPPPRQDRWWDCLGRGSVPGTEDPRPPALPQRLCLCWSLSCKSSKPRHSAVVS